MENQTGYDLNAAVENWRRELAAQPSLTADERREVETHLRDAISAFQQRGLNDEDSFWLARRRVGQPQQLGEEFAKNDPVKMWRERLFWMVLALFLMVTVGRVPFLASTFFLDENQGVVGVLFYLFYLIPAAVVILLGAGKMTRQFSKLTELINGRFRLASVAIILILASSFFDYLAVPHMNSIVAKSGAHELPQSSFSFGLGDVLVLLIPAVLLIWLFPKGNREQLWRA
jgi:hypothetical protein